MHFNDIKLPAGRALGAAAVTLAAVSIVQRVKKSHDSFGYFIAAAVSGAAALLLVIDKLDWDSQVADLKKFVVDTGRAAQLDHLRSVFMRGKTENKVTDDGTACCEGADDAAETPAAETPEDTITEDEETSGEEI